MALTDKQERFCREYLRDLNATKAALRAGFSKKTAMEQGYQLLQKTSVKKRVKTLMDARAKRVGVKADAVVREAANVAFARMDLACDWDDKGNLFLYDRDTMGDNELSAMKNLKEHKQYHEGVEIGKSMEITFHDKMKALELLMKHLGILDGKGSGEADKTDVREAILQHLEKHGGRNRRSSSCGNDKDKV